MVTVLGSLSVSGIFASRYGFIFLLGTNCWFGLNIEDNPIAGICGHTIDIRLVSLQSKPILRGHVAAVVFDAPRTSLDVSNLEGVLSNGVLGENLSFGIRSRSGW